MSNDSGFDPEAARQQRLATALRANLMRRKARDREASVSPPEPKPD